MSLPTGPDQDRIKAAVVELLTAIGDDPSREGLLETPRRIAEMYGEIFDGLFNDPKEHLKVVFAVQHDELVILRNIPFYSMCAHHGLPFWGTAAVGYLPAKNGDLVGLSKLARVVEHYAHRFQTQEQITEQTADHLQRVLKPRGVGVVLRAESEPGYGNVVVGTLQLGARQDNKVFARRPDEVTVYSLAPKDVARLPYAAWQLRDRRVWSFTTNQIARVTVRHGGKDVVALGVAITAQFDIPELRTAVDEALGAGADASYDFMFLPLTGSESASTTAGTG